MKSIFTDKSVTPDTQALKKAVGKNVNSWNTIVDFTLKNYPDAKQEWKFSGEKFGWSFRISDKKRVLVYLLPRDKFFKVAFVFGQKAVDELLKSKIDVIIKTELRNAKPNAEGCGIRIDITNETLLNDIKRLIEVKIAG